jgi:hypothetical protein
MEEVRSAGSLPSKSDGAQAIFTVQQYSKAINRLQPSRTSTARTSVRITLLTCALFVYMEFLRGHYTTGIVHLKHGLSLLQETEFLPTSQPSSSPHVDAWLVTIFTRLLVQTHLSGQARGFQYQALLDFSLQPYPNKFASSHHARRSLEHIILCTFSLQEQSQQPTAKLGTALRRRQKVIQMELQAWFKIHQATVSNSSPRFSLMETVAYRLLRLYHQMALILAGTCLETLDETRFDGHISDFAGIISQCIEIYDLTSTNSQSDTESHRDPEAGSPNSVSDMGWIAPLYMTAIKCRNRRIRHQAVKLLQSSRHKEGIWNSTLCALVARQIIEIEEENLYDCRKPVDFDKLAAPTEEDLATPALPGEFRLRKIEILLPDDRSGKLLLTCCRMEGNGLTQWISKVYDLPSGQWRDVRVNTRRPATRCPDVP